MIFSNVNRNKLHQELVDAGIKIISVSAIDNTPIGAEIIFVQGTDMKLVQSIIDAHDNSPLPQPPTVEEQLAERNRQVIELKKNQSVTDTTVSEISTTLQELIEFTMEMGNI